MSDTSHGTGNPYKIYLITWFALLVITVAMLAAEKLHMPRWFLLLFLLGFMVVKAVMISGFFMHLKFEKPNLSVIVAVGLVVTSLILYAFITPESQHILDHTTYKAAPAAAPATH
jgi:cytochrome c oxidase subunit IV